MNDDPVNPAHYRFAGDVYEPIKVIRAWSLGFALGNAIKYIARAGRKNPATMIEDLRKARWYLDYEIKALEGAQATSGTNGSAT